MMLMRDTVLLLLLTMMTELNSADELPTCQPVRSIAEIVGFRAFWGTSTSQWRIQGLGRSPPDGQKY